jgi:hypothetical protein
MYRVTCKQCGASGITDNGHRLQAAVSCPCCPEAHDHDEAANACPEVGQPLDARHGGAACPHPSENGVGCSHLTPVGEPCPGGHCWPGVDGCTVCRPLTVEWLGLVPLGGVS